MYSSPVHIASVLDCAHPNTHGYPSWASDPSATDQHDPRLDEWGNIHSRVIHTSVQKHFQQPTTIDYNKLKS